jgi:putative SOS response-associated peptidase YedK
MPTLPFEEFSERARINIAPSQLIPVVRINSQGHRVLELARWGFIPYWAKSLPKLQPINARAETLGAGGLFRAAFERRRCLIPADGFYEWKAGETRVKQPYFFHYKDDRPFAFAGLWERWKPAPDAQPLETCTIITTQPNDLLKPIHNRMPAIVHPKDYARWLDPNIPSEAVRDLLRPCPIDDWETFAVSTRVNRATEDGPDLLDPCD